MGSVSVSIPSVLLTHFLKRPANILPFTRPTEIYLQRMGGVRIHGSLGDRRFSEGFDCASPPDDWPLWVDTRLFFWGTSSSRFLSDGCDTNMGSPDGLYRCDEGHRFPCPPDTVPFFSPATYKICSMILSGLETSNGSTIVKLRAFSDAAACGNGCDVRRARKSARCRSSLMQESADTTLASPSKGEFGRSSEHHLHKNSRPFDGMSRMLGKKKHGRGKWY
ncbi:unnamed protein product [Scytosiphon promiscuus]